MTATQGFLFLFLLSDSQFKLANFILHNKTIIFLQMHFHLIEPFCKHDNTVFSKSYLKNIYMYSYTMHKHTHKRMHTHTFLLSQNENANEFISLRVAPNGNLCTFKKQNP